MKSRVSVFLVLFCLCMPLSFAEAASPDHDMKALVCLTVNRDNVLLRYLPDLSSTPDTASFPVHSVNAQAQLWAERWPVTNNRDQSRWYKVLFAVDKESGRCMTANPVRYSLYDYFRPVYVPVDAVTVREVQPEEAAALADTRYGKAFRAFDLSPEGQKRYVDGDYHLFQVESIATGGRSLPDRNAPEFAVPCGYEGELALIGGSTDKKGQRWYQMLDKENGGDFWVRKEDCRLLGGHFTASEMLALINLYAGANLNDMARRWDVEKVERVFAPDLTEEWGVEVFQEEVTARGMYYLNGMGSWKLVLTEEGAPFFTLRIGQSSREDVEKLMGRPVATGRERDGENVGQLLFLPEHFTDEVWWFHAEGEFFNQVACKFNGKGLLSGVMVEGWRAY